MFSQENGNFIRFYLLLFKVGTDLLRKIVEKDLNTENKTIDEILTSQGTETRICGYKYVTKEMKTKLYPPHPKMRDISQWDIAILCFILLEFFKQNLDTPGQVAVAKIRDFRNKISHQSEPVIDNGNFTNWWTDLVLIIKTLSYGMSLDYDHIIRSITYVELDLGDALAEIKSIVQNNHDDMGATLHSIEQLERLQLAKLEDIQEKVFNLSSSTDRVLNQNDAILEELKKRGQENEDMKYTLTMLAKVLAGDKMIEESAEKCLFEVSRARLEQCPSYEPLEPLRANVDKLFDDIEKEGNTLSDVKKGSIILEFACPSLAAMLQLIDYWFKGLIHEHLKYIKESLEDIVGEKIDLDVYIPREQFKNIVSNLGDRKYKSVEYTVTCNGIKGIEHILDLFKNGAACNSLNAVATALSDVVGKPVSLETSIDLQHIEDVMMMEATGEENIDSVTCSQATVNIVSQKDDNYDSAVMKTQQQTSFQGIGTVLSSAEKYLSGVQMESTTLEPIIHEEDDSTTTLKVSEKQEIDEKEFKQARIEPDQYHSTADDVALHEFKEELVRFYQNNESTIPASPLVEDHAVPLTELYVQPPMSAFIKPNAFGQGHKSPEKTTVSSYRKLLFNDDNVPYKHIYVEANAGYGKTSFTQNIAMTWSQPNMKNKTISKFVDVDTLQRFDLLFLLHLRGFQEEDMCLLDDLIIKFVAQSLPDPERFSEKFIKSMLRTRPCLVLCDGLDEWTHPIGKCVGKPGIPHNNYGENCTVLTTTRPWKISTIGLTPNHIDQHVEITQLDEATSEELKSKAVKLLSKNSGEKERDLTDFDRKVSSVKLGDIRMIPYILLQLICIWFDGLSIGKSKCETYSNTIELTLQRGLNKKNPPTLPTGNAERNFTVPECMRHNVLCNQYMNLLLKLGKLAFYALFQKIKESSLVIDSTTVLKFLTVQELEFCLKIGLLSQSKDRSKVSVKRYQVYFQHKSIQEFMAALYITSEWNNGTIKSTILEVCSSLSSILEMENLFVFVCGMNSEVYTCISGELQTIVDLDSSVCQFRTYMYIDRYDDAWKSMKSYQSLQLECVQESLRNGNDSCPIPLYFVLDKYSLTYDVKALKSIMQVNESIGKSPQVSLNEKIVASMLSERPPFVFMQSLDPGVFTSLETLRVEHCDKEPVWLAVILTESARTLKCLTLSLRYLGISLSAISITALTGLTCLQSLYLAKVNMTHSNLKCLYDYITQTTTLTQLKLGFIHCSDHRGQYRDCDVTLDLHRLSELKILDLVYVPCIELHVNTTCLEKLEFQPPRGEKMTARASATLWQDLHAAPVLSSLTLWWMTSCQEMIQTIPTLTQLQHLKLGGIDMDDVIPRVSPGMTRLQRVVLYGVKMSSAAFREFLLSVGQLQHPVKVELKLCGGSSRKEWQTFMEEIKSTPTLSWIQYLNLMFDYD